LEKELEGIELNDEVDSVRWMLTWTVYYIIAIQTLVLPGGEGYDFRRNVAIKAAIEG
jgi:hypothetical protein